MKAITILFAAVAIIVALILGYPTYSHGAQGLATAGGHRHTSHGRGGFGMLLGAGPKPSERPPFPWNADPVRPAPPWERGCTKFDDKGHWTDVC